MAGRRTVPSIASHRNDPPAALEFLSALWELNHALVSASRAMKKHLGVTGPERLFIRLIGQNPGIAPAEIADIMHVHRSTLTPVIKRLESRKLVNREDNPLDGRSFQLFLTPAGQRIDDAREGTIESVVGKELAASTQREVETTTGMLTKVARRLARRMACR